MKEGPDIARIAALVGDPARANMLGALMGGAALTASELAHEAGVGLPTASSHLARLSDGGLVTVASQGRHRYFALASPQIAAMLESIMGVAASFGPKRTQPGPKDGAMRTARVCYDHLAGDLGVAMFDSLLKRDVLAMRETGPVVGPAAPAFLAETGIDAEALAHRRRPVCRSCLDWSVRRTHLAGTLGAAILDRLVADRWARRDASSRAIHFSPAGLRRFESLYLG